MNTQPRLGMLAFLDTPVNCRMSGAVNEDGDVRFTVGGPFDEFDIVFEPAALYRFVELTFDLLCQAARSNPRVLAARAAHGDAARFEFGAEALRKLAKLSDARAQMDRQLREEHAAPDNKPDMGELVGAGGRSA